MLESLKACETKLEDLASRRCEAKLEHLTTGLSHTFELCCASMPTLPRVAVPSIKLLGSFTFTRARVSWARSLHSPRGRGDGVPAWEPQPAGSNFQAGRVCVFKQ